jgi:hypothetical protein
LADKANALPVRIRNRDLEDADCGTLVRATQSMQFTVASKSLLAVIDDILNA